jgi:hypothetical protein
MRSTIIARACSILAMAFLMQASSGTAYSAPDADFLPADLAKYDPKVFSVTDAKFSLGGASIQVVEAKNIAKDQDRHPYACRAWVEVTRAGRSTFRRYYDDIDAAGSSYGVFIPEKQPPPPFFAVVKSGDNDGRLFLVHKNGIVMDLMGGLYFISKDRRFLFSQYASDSDGLVVFDLAGGRTVFNSARIPAIYRWYQEGEIYFFTEAEWNADLEQMTEKKGVGFFFDFNTNQLMPEKLTEAEVAAAKPVVYDFDPGKQKDCSAVRVTSPSTGEQKKRAP